MIYMDNAATTKMRPEVVRAMLPYMGNRYGNPSGIYTFSKNVKQDVSSARQRLAATIHARPEEIFMTSGGTESDNWALKMAADEHRGGHIITTAIEHHAILKSCEYLQKRGISVTYVRPDNFGQIHPEEIEKAIRKDTFLISVMAANNEIGTIQPVAQIGRLAKSRNILFHTDAVQAYTNMEIDVTRMQIDLLSVSGHKINGPKGVGFLYIRSGCLNTSFMNGGGQEMGMRAGTENVSGIIGLKTAAEIALANFKARTGREIYLRNYMIRRVLDEIPDSQLNGHPEQRLPNNMNFSFAAADGATLIVMLDQQGICASAGSACSSASSASSHVLKAIGLTDELAHATVRFTINEEITRQEIDYTVECLKRDVWELRSLSDTYPQKTRR